MGGRITADVRSGSDFSCTVNFWLAYYSCLHNVDYDVCKSLSEASRDPKPELTAEDCLELSRIWTNLPISSSPTIKPLMRHILKSIDQLKLKRLMISWFEMDWWLIWGGANPAWSGFGVGAGLEWHRHCQKLMCSISPPTSSLTLPLLNSAEEDKCGRLHILGRLLHPFVWQAHHPLLANVNLSLADAYGKYWKN